MAHKLLIVEDDSFLLTAYKAKFEREGFEVTIATDGQKALELLEKYRPDVILMDLVMPRLDGYATLEAIKKRPEWQDIPVIVASNLAQDEDIARARALGATDVLTKSNMSLADIVARLNKLWGGPPKPTQSAANQQ